LSEFAPLLTYLNLLNDLSMDVSFSIFRRLFGDSFKDNGIYLLIAFSTFATGLFLIAFLNILVIVWQGPIDVITGFSLSSSFSFLFTKFGTNPNDEAY
jgi:hypothetical protein